MKTTLAILASVVLLIFSSLAQDTRLPATSSQGYLLSIQTDKKTYSTGEHISLTLTLKNLKTNDVSVAVASAEQPFVFYEFHLLSQNGKPVPLTAIGETRVKNAKTGGSLYSTLLKPGMETSTTVPLDKYFELQGPDKYSLSVTRQVRMNNSNMWTNLLSNQIEITVEASNLEKK